MYGIATGAPAFTLPAAAPPRRLSVRAAVSTFAEPRLADTSSRRRSLYDVLRVERTATQTEIKKAYRMLAKQYHPDCACSGDGALDFIDIHNAYETLSDPSARAIYDLSLRGPPRPLGAAVGYGYYTTRRWETDQCW